MVRSLSRRHFIGTAALSGAAVAALGGRAVLGQENAATPVAGGVPVEASPAASDSVGLAINVPAPTPTPLGPAVPPEISDNPTNWAAEGLNLENTRNVQGSTIAAANVAQLGKSWSFGYSAAGMFGAVTSQSVIVGDILYTQDTTSNVFALNKTTGEVLWSKEYNEPIPSGGPSGVAVGYGYAVYQVGNGRVAAVKADTGEDAWIVDITGPRGEGITMTPGIHDSTVFISTIPGNLSEFYTGGLRGVLHALELATGRVLWYFDTTTDNLWGNPRTNSGGGLWHPPAFDADGNIYIDVANPAPWPGTEEYPNGTSRPGDNLYTNSIVRLNPATAGPDWYLSVKPHDLFDLDNQLSPVLADIDGRLLVFASGKHGFVVAADANTGEQVWKTAVGTHQNDDATELPDDGQEPLEVFPGSLGGVETPFAYANGVVYVSLLNGSTKYTKTEFTSGTPLTEATGQVVALNASTGEIIWDVTVPSPQLAAATVVNDLVFTAGLDGVVRAFAAADGSQVWTWQASAGINAPLAVSGDFLFVAAGGPFIPSADTWNPAPETAFELTAITLGGEIQVAPEGGSTPEAATPEAGGGASSGTALSIETVDIAFSTNTLDGPANTDIQLTVTNKGSIPHDWVSDDLGVKTKLLNSGETETLTINAAAGSYNYYCSVPGHKEAGMSGTLTLS
jgi:outer membrane protein assembly factor BamB/plastocyanin